MNCIICGNKIEKDICPICGYKYYHKSFFKRKNMNTSQLPIIKEVDHFLKR